MDAGGNQQAESLRAALVSQMVAEGSLRDNRVAAAFLAVPRHAFVPMVPLAVAYADDVVLMKRDEAGVAISSVSQPSVVALMLEQAGIQPGHRVLEIGSGGYNAALLSELVGPEGTVTTIDIDPEVIERARHGLAAAGYQQVRVVLADGEFGSPESAPYDRIVVTVTAWDIAPAWVAQLATRGRIVVPLRFRGQTRSIALDLVDGRLESRSMKLCGFVCMQGAGASYERVVSLENDTVRLGFDTDQEILEPPADVLRQPSSQVWSGVGADREEALSDLNLWLAAALDQYCVLAADRSAVKKHRVSPTPRWGTSATVSDGTLAYLTSRPGKDRDTLELGAVAHGPAAEERAEHLVRQIQTFDAHHRHGPPPLLTIYPASAPHEAEQTPELDREAGRIVDPPTTSARAADGGVEPAGSPVGASGVDGEPATSVGAGWVDGEPATSVGAGRVEGEPGSSVGAGGVDGEPGTPVGAGEVDGERAGSSVRLRIERPHTRMIVSWPSSS
ncbi:protein-L-isoaspartate(D-aspartate) O-methyltransferase [Kribbella voronezhensis]|uniref:Protein-L-isoaspartate O-methyltransferase n=1 Tax=Kribbella voronezhensis TaxID=2512212 RepID=A0A4R7SW95_9ACTN|nr:methyltransferase, FxLD system [Kribbella voronezhensis]TDU83491.1 protein-L-isoaspartate(D-aspartate) O-methyltransferase [Kribbella voronezhensis]